LKKGLVKAKTSEDTSPPKSKVLSMTKQDTIVLTGRANDEGGGVVAGVEVS
jgi:hypothetical protein